MFNYICQIRYDMFIIRNKMLRNKNTLIMLALITGLTLTSSNGYCQHKLFLSTINSPNKWVDSVFARMSLKEKIAQVFMVRVYSDRDDIYRDSVLRLIKKEHIGGLVFFSGGPKRQAGLTDYFQKNSKVPLLIAMDGEWGLGMRIDSVISYPFQMALGAIQDNRLIYKMGLMVANDFKRVGMQMNFAPDMDINNNPDNPVINYRSFGDDRANVTAKGLAYMKGMQDGGILTTAKHFPGHGDTNIDSHLNLPLLNFSIERLDSLEEYPFKMAIDSGISGIMIAHMNIPALDTTKNLPSTLSRPIVTGLLKQRLGFKGLVVSDAMNMKGVVKYFPDGEADLRAFTAGNDILELSENTNRAIEKIKKAIDHGQIDIEELDAKVKKILYAKYWAGLNVNKAIATEKLDDDLNSETAKAFVQNLADQFVTSLKKTNLLPVKADKKLLILNIGTKLPTKFTQYLLSYYPGCEVISVDNTSSEKEVDSVINRLGKTDQLITAIYDTRQRPKSSLDINKKLTELIGRAAAHERNVVAVFANPYTLNTFPGIQYSGAILECYQMSESAQYAAFKVITGEIKPNGKLPVSVNSYFRFGTGF